MDRTQIEQIIAAGENDTVEFKTSFNAKTIETLVAFANYEGGTVLVGVSDNKIITGVSISNESIQSWLNEIKSKTEPSIIPEFKKYEIDGKSMVIIQIHEFPIKPVAFQGRYYKRFNCSNHLLSISEVSELFLQSMQVSWDSYLYPNAVSKLPII